MPYCTQRILLRSPWMWNFSVISQNLIVCGITGSSYQIGCRVQLNNPSYWAAHWLRTIENILVYHSGCWASPAPAFARLSSLSQSRSLETFFMHKNICIAQIRSSQFMGPSVCLKLFGREPSQTELNIFVSMASWVPFASKKNSWKNVFWVIQWPGLSPFWAPVKLLPTCIIAFLWVCFHLYSTDSFRAATMSYLFMTFKNCFK